MNLQDKNIVIPGGAQGLGLEMARMCATAGAHLALIDMNETQLAAAQTELAATGVTVRTYLANVANEAGFRIDQVMPDSTDQELLTENSQVKYFDLPISFISRFSLVLV